jgi:hypothetical protein
MPSKLKQARNRVEALRLALLSSTPEQVDAALPGLNEAALFLASVEQDLLAGDGAPDDVRQELKLLKNDLRISARLIAQGLEFCRGWAETLGGGPAYTRGGHTAPAPAEGTLSLQG